MSNPIDAIFSDLGITESDLTINHARWYLDQAYDQIELKCKEEGINLAITRDEFLLEYDQTCTKTTFASLHNYVTKVSTAILASKEDEKHGLGFVAPPNVVAGTVAGAVGISRFFPGDRFANIASDVIGSLSDQAGQAVQMKVDEMISNISGGILGGGPNKPGRPAPPASGGGDRGETYGGTGSTQPIGTNFVNYVHPTKKLDYSLGIPTNLRGTDPFDKQYDKGGSVLFSALTMKVIKFELPREEPMFKSFYENIWVPQVRDYLQGEKKLNTNLAKLVTADRMQKYLETVGRALQIYHFFVNVFNYNLLGEGMNTNAGLRFIREDMFSTTNLQRLSLLKERLDGLPWPQTFDSEIAYHGLIYTQSDIPFSGCIMNVPDIFLSNVYVPVAGDEVCVIDSIRPDIIQDTLDKLDFRDLTQGTDREDMLRFIGAICNTTNFQSSMVSSVQIEPYTDPVFNTEYVNNNVYLSQVPNPASANAFDTVRIIYPRSGVNSYDPVDFYSYTNDVPGMLQGTFAPTANNNAYYEGFWQPVPTITAFSTTNPTATVTNVSNIMFFVDSIPNQTLVDGVGAVSSRGGFVHSNPSTQSCWKSNDFIEQPTYVRDTTNSKWSNRSNQLKPYGSQLIVNMSIQQCFQQRKQYFSQIMESSGWAIGRDMSGMKVSNSGRKKRYGKSGESEDMD